MINFPKDRNIHRPPHIYLDNTIYFVTSSTLERRKYINTNEKKDIFIKALNKALKFYNFVLYGWVLLSNHYHLLLKTKIGLNLFRFINKLNSDVAIALNKIDHSPGRRIFYQYWDECLRNNKREIDNFYSWVNYLHINPLKHREIKIKGNLLYNGKDKIIIPKENTNDIIFILNHYKYSSFNSYLKRYGKDWLMECFRDHPVRFLKYDGF